MAPCQVITGRHKLSLCAYYDLYAIASPIVQVLPASTVLQMKPGLATPSTMAESASKAMMSRKSEITSRPSSRKLKRLVTGLSYRILGLISFSTSLLLTST